MQVKPTHWTHHHIHRLYHISMLATFIFIILAITYGIFAILFKVNADQLLEQGSVNITASVPGMESGQTQIVTSTGGGVGLAFNAQPQPPVQAQPGLEAPFVTIAPASGIPIKLIKLSGGKTASLPAFDTQSPTFFGTTSIGNAVIFLKVESSKTISSAVYADAKGNWTWTSTEPITPGVHTIYVTAQDLQVPILVSQTQMDFYIEPSAQGSIVSNLPFNSSKLTVNPAGNLFDVLVKIPDEFKIVAPGDELEASIQLINFGSSGHPVDAEVEYTIVDSQGKVIMQSSETIAVATTISIIKSFTTAPNLTEGSYKLIVRVPSQDIIATASDTFAVKGSAIIALGTYGKIDFTFVFQALLFLLFLFIFVVYFEYNKVASLNEIIKKVDEQDIISYNQS